MSRWRLLLVPVGLLVTVMSVSTSLFARVVNALSVPITAESVVWLLGYLAFAVVGALVALRRPEHPLGWMFLGIGVFGGLSEGASGVGTLQVGSGEFGAVAGWLSAWIWAPSLGLVVWSMVLFPTGEPLNRLTSIVGRGVFGLSVAMAAVGAVDLWPVRSAELATMLEGPDRFSTRFIMVTFPVLLLCAVTAMLSVIVRYRRSRGVERQQMKWLAAAAGIAAPSILASQVVTEGTLLFEILNSLGAPGWFAVAAGVAILRYRLYDIDRIISRTLAYAVMTAVLVAVYAGGVLGFGAIARAVSGSSSDLVVAGSTLLVAALFAPVRGRVQSLVDRRFNRSRVDAMRAAEDFGRSLREEVDLRAVTSELRSVVGRTLEPTWTALSVTRGRAS